jgi:hypothetical protein
MWPCTMKRLKRIARIALWRLQSATVQNIEKIEHAASGDGELKALQ